MARNDLRGDIHDNPSSRFALIAGVAVLVVLLVMGLLAWQMGYIGRSQMMNNRQPVAPAPATPVPAEPAPESMPETP